jgi:katanin p80 WD40 repeat-containing subunit B1
MSPDARWVASGSSDGCLKIWDVTADKLLANFETPNQSVTCLQFNPQTLTMANGSTDRTVKFWDLE